MEAGTLVGLQPAGDALVLCVVVALIFVGLIVGGFALLRQGERGAKRPAGAAHHDPRRLGLLGLWRLERTLRRTGEHLPSAGQARQIDAVR